MRRMLDLLQSSVVIRLVARNRMFYMREMDANLMCATGFDFYFDKREFVETLDDTIKRERVTA